MSKNKLSMRLQKKSIKFQRYKLSISKLSIFKSKTSIFLSKYFTLSNAINFSTTFWNKSQANISQGKLALGSFESTKRLRITREQGYQWRHERYPLRRPRCGNFAGELLSRAEPRPQRSVVLPGSSSSPVSRTYVKQRPKQPADLRDRSGGTLTCSSRQTVAVS